MLKLAVVGKDVSRSDSPRMHGFILRKMGTECVYDKISVPPQEFSARAEPLFAAYDAFNVTIPFKEEIVSRLAKLEGDAHVFGAVNTVVTRTRTGYNTDGAGFLLMLENAGGGVFSSSARAARAEAVSKNSQTAGGASLPMNGTRNGSPRYIAISAALRRSMRSPPHPSTL